MRKLSKTEKQQIDLDCGFMKRIIDIEMVIMARKDIEDLDNSIIIKELTDLKEFAEKLFGKEIKDEKTSN